MAICRASLILPGCHLEEFPTHLLGDRAEEILAAWTALWHPAILSTTGALPTWHPAGSPPEPDSLEGELVIVPAISDERLPRDWREQFQATYPRNPPLVEPLAERCQMVAAVLEAAALDLRPPDVDVVGDFLALGYAYLQIELLTRAMRHAKLLDTGQFATVVVEAARAAIDGNEEGVHDGLTRAFDLLGDTRNHYYPVDFFLVDVTLLSPDTLGEPLRANLAGGMPTSLLAPADLIEQMARHH
ncbi:MAG: hypothetical protein L0Z07_03105, partial [Planctomycetes bacterium]|nr:hypothetical protein [Planctomycetota bacterium]